MRKSRLRRLGTCLLIGGLVGSTGCTAMQLVTPPELVEACMTVPSGCRNHVYLFFLHGLDPCTPASLSRLCGQVQKAGFKQTYTGYLHNLPEFAYEIHRIHGEDPNAHFVLIGCSLGGSAVHSVVRVAEWDGAQVDRVFYLSGPLAKSHADSEQELGDPDDPATLTRLLNELTELAAQVPYTPPPPYQPKHPLDEQPTPRPVMPQSTSRRDEWDFLKPVTILKPTPLVAEPEKVVANEPAE